MRIPWLSRQKTKQKGWPLDRINIHACAEVWGLDEPVPYITDLPETFLSDPKPRGCCYHDWIDQGLAAPIWLNPEFVEKGTLVSKYDGTIGYLLATYTHEVGHYLVGEDPDGAHRIEFAAINAFLLSRIPSDWNIRNISTRDYNVHQINQVETPYRRGAKAINWQDKAPRYASRIAFEWARELAKDPSLTAPEAMEVIREWEIERRQEIEKHERIGDRIAIAVAGLFVLAGIGIWVWRTTRPLI